jgi:uncharacterized damage-inducible protein DinB
MNRAYVQTLWEELRLVQGITFRVIDAVPKDKIDTRPVKDMRTPKELVAHMYETMRSVADGAIKGQIADKGTKIKTHEDLVRFAKECWKSADKAVQSMTDAQATAMVKTPWGMDFPGWVCIQIIFDEHLHHRGQLYAFLRALGIEPPFMWDFENSAPEFKPKQHQQA